MTVSPQEAKRLILSGLANSGMSVSGTVDLGEKARIGSLPQGLRCHVLRAIESDLEAIPEAIEAPFRIDLTGSSELAELPDGLVTGSLILRNCVRLRKLPRGLRVNYLDLGGCSALTQIPEDLDIRYGRLDLTGCIGIHELPRVGPLSDLVLNGLVDLRSLPEDLDVSSSIDVAFCGLEGLPQRLKKVPLRWRGVPVSPRIAFEGHLLTADEVLGEENTELRRVMIEAMGYDRFLDMVDRTTIDADEDAGGPRELLEVEIEGGENLVCVSFSCPSTGRRYVVRVPPNVRSCHQAVAWIAGFDDPDDYRPLVET